MKSLASRPLDMNTVGPQLYADQLKQLFICPDWTFTKALRSKNTMRYFICGCTQVGITPLSSWGLQKLHSQRLEYKFFTVAPIVCVVRWIEVESEAVPSPLFADDEVMLASRGCDLECELLNLRPNVKWAAPSRLRPQCRENDLVTPLWVRRKEIYPECTCENEMEPGRLL